MFSSSLLALSTKFRFISFWHFPILLIFLIFFLYSLAYFFLLFTFYFTFAGLRVLMEILLYFLVSHILLDAPEATAKQWKLVLLLCLFFGCDAPFPQCSSPCSTHCLRRTACWLSLWLPPLWSSAMGEGKGPETEGFWQKTLAFYCPCYCCCIYLAAVKAVEECTFLRLSRFCVLPAPLSPNPLVLCLPQAGTLFAAAELASHFILCLCWWCWVLSHKI